MAIDDLGKLAIGVVIIALLIGTGLTMLSEFNDIDDLKFESGLVSENWTATQVTKTLAQDDLIAASLHNATSPFAEYVVGNYTLNLAAGTIALTAGSNVNDTATTVRYTFYYESPANNATGTNITSLADIPTWIPIIILIVIIMLLLGFVYLVKGTGER